MTDRMIALLRTVVPALWAGGFGWLTAWLLGHQVPVEFVDALGPLQPVGEIVLVPLCVGLVYEGARWLQQQRWMPGWAVLVLLGSTRQPTYSNPPGDFITRPSLTQTEAAEIRERWIREYGEPPRSAGR